MILYDYDGRKLSKPHLTTTRPQPTESDQSQSSPNQATKQATDSQR